MPSLRIHCSYISGAEHTVWDSRKGRDAVGEGARRPRMDNSVACMTLAAVDLRPHLLPCQEQKN